MIYFLRRNRLVIYTILSLIGLPLLWDPVYLLLTLIAYYVFLFGIEVGMHRYYSHGSFESNTLGKIFMWLCIFPSGLGEPIGFSKQHRYHHKHADTELDNNPINESILRAWIQPKHVDQSKINVSDLTKNKFLSFMYDHYFSLYYLFLILVALVDYKIAFYGMILPTAIALNASGVANTVCHMNFGYRNFETNDSSSNVPFLKFVFLGGHLHNNHHANPGSYSLKAKPTESDLLGTIIEKFLIKK